MKSLLTSPGLDTAPVETGGFRTRRRRPPVSVHSLQILLLTAAASVIATWLFAWDGVQAYAWPGVDNGLTARGLAYLLILAPAVPVDLLAAIWLTRGGSRARLYLAGAASLAVAQAVLLLTPQAMPLQETMSDGAHAVGLRYLLTVGPLLFIGAWLAGTDQTRAWLDTAPRPHRRVFTLEAAVWCLALACVIGMGAEVRQWAGAAAEPEPPSGEHTETGTWARLELAVTETTDTLPSFLGFTARALDVQACGYNTPAGLPTYRYLLTYELRSPADDTAIALRWNEGDYRLTYDGATLDGTRRITADRVVPTETEPHTITLAYTGGDVPSLHAASPCVERTGTPECLPPQGDPMTDTITGITCPRRD